MPLPMAVPRCGCRRLMAAVTASRSVVGACTMAALRRHHPKCQGVYPRVCVGTC